MRYRVAGLGLVIGMAVFCGGRLAEAHMRDYLVNQPYYTTRQGEVEMEVWTDFNLHDANDDGTYSFRQQYEFEYGLTDHWQWAFYEVLKWDPTDDFEQDAFKVETKYRLFESGVLPVDLAFYGEYKNPNGRKEGNSDELEGKFIMSRDVGPWNLVANFITEKKLNASEPWEFEYTVGASYPLTDRIRAGLELRETLGNGEEFGLRRNDHELQLVPGLYVSLTPHLRVLFGTAIGLSKAADDLDFKSIVECEF